MVKLFRKEQFYKVKKIIKFCRFPNCGVMFRPDNNPYNKGLCYVHRKQYQREQYKKWKANLTPEQKEKIKEYGRNHYPQWLIWVSKNIERRRRIALRSYHRRKKEPKNKMRRHRRTKII